MYKTVQGMHHSYYIRHDKHIKRDTSNWHTPSITLLIYKVCGSHSGLGAKEKLVRVLNPNRLSRYIIMCKV